MITTVSAAEFDTAIDNLTEILHDCVHGGASIGFVLPFSMAQARDYWQTSVRPAVLSGATQLFAARRNGQIVGTAQLVPASMPNQKHRADVSKLLVHRDARRLGIGRQLMLALQDSATGLGRTMLVLDTRSSDPSLLLYQKLGFQIAGEIPNYCRNPFDERLEPTTFMYKDLAADQASISSASA